MPVPVVLLGDDILLFLVPLLLCILLLRFILPDEAPSPLIVPLCMVLLGEVVPLCMVPVPVCVPVPMLLVEVPVPLVPLVPVPLVGVVWAKAAVLTQNAQAAVKNNLVIFMAIST